MTFEIDKLNKTFLLSIPNLGRKKAGLILSSLKQKEFSFQDLWRQSPGVIKKIDLNESQVEAIKNFKKDFSIFAWSEYLLQKNIQVIFPENNSYPQLLKLCEDKPLILFVKGNQSLLKNNSLPIAIVGSRKMTPYGESVIEYLVKDFALYNVQIISGFMYGVDVYAHEQSLAHQIPTIAVLGFGFDHLYPRFLQSKFDKFLKLGMTFISEFPPDVRAQNYFFPMRNRIIAGMSLATIVIEAAKKSGSLITAAQASDYSREVFAIPASIFNPLSAGTSYLINNGASLFTTVEDLMKVVQDRAWLLSPNKKINKNFSRKIQGPGDQLQMQTQTVLELDIINFLKNQSFSINELQSRCKVNTNLILETLSLLELHGKVTRKGNEWYKKGI